MIRFFLNSHSLGQNDSEIEKQESRSHLASGFLVFSANRRSIETANFPHMI